MDCPKCGGITRKKMNGAVCLEDNCKWSTRDVSKEVKPEYNGFYYGRDIDGNEGYFQDYEQSIGEA